MIPARDESKAWLYIYLHSQKEKTDIHQNANIYASQSIELSLLEFSPKYILLEQQFGFPSNYQDTPESTPLLHLQSV